MIYQISLLPQPFMERISERNSGVDVYVGGKNHLVSVGIFRCLPSFGSLQLPHVYTCFAEFKGGIVGAVIVVTAFVHRFCRPIGKLYTFGKGGQRAWSTTESTDL